METATSITILHAPFRADCNAFGPDEPGHGNTFFRGEIVSVNEDGDGVTVNTVDDAGNERNIELPPFPIEMIDSLCKLFGVETLYGAVGQSIDVHVRYYRDADGTILFSPANLRKVPEDRSLPFWTPTLLDVESLILSDLRGLPRPELGSYVLTDGGEVPPELTTPFE